MKRLLILSGKGGTGKTTAAAAFIRFAQAKAVADCDVDAPNLHLLSKHTTLASVSDFLGGDKAEIIRDKCIACGQCQSYCRFDAIKEKDGFYWISENNCEGCGVCAYVCPQKAVELKRDVAGKKELYMDEGVFSSATLKMGRGNSGKLVAEVKMAMIKNAPETDLAIIDGSPGIGCPVIASLSGMDLALIVAEPSLSGLSDLHRLVKTAVAFETKLAVCVNKWDVSPVNTEAIQAFCEEKGIPFVGRIPYEKNASKAVNACLSLADVACPAREALKIIYENILLLLNQ